MTDLSTVDIDGLIAAGAALDDRDHGLFAAMSAITATARGAHGIEVTVNLEGKPIALDLGEATRRLSAQALTSELRALIGRASAEALTAGTALLEPVVGKELATQLTRPPEPRALPEDEDFSGRTWELRD
ncbi:MAG: hypothetical protein M3548_06860 [Actinomycetota bacterium]|nr:hypothetical protein [Actinomycetota bacterium]